MHAWMKATALVALFSAFAIGEGVIERAAHAQRRAPSFDVDPRWPKMPSQWILGQVAGLAVDARDHVWIIQRPWSLEDDEKASDQNAPWGHPSPPVMEFDSDGRVHIFDRKSREEVGGFGRIGHYAGEFVFLHNVAVDSKGSVYASEVGNGKRVQKFVRRP
jgi:hypothetical protein